MFASVVNSSAGKTGEHTFHLDASDPKNIHIVAIGSLPWHDKHETHDEVWKSIIALTETSICKSAVDAKYVYDPDETVAMIGGLSLQARANIASKKRAIAAVLYRVVKTRHGNTQRPVAFAIAKVVPDGVYLDVICAHNGSGVPMMTAFMHFVEAEYPRAVVSLSAMSTVLTLYQRFGFQFRDSCSTPAIPLVNAAKLVARTKDPTMKKLPATTAQAYHDGDVIEALQFLQRERLNVYKKGRCGIGTIKGVEIADADCGRDGYAMKKCPGVPNSVRAKTSLEQVKRAPKQILVVEVDEAPGTVENSKVDQVVGAKRARPPTRGKLSAIAREKNIAKRLRPSTIQRRKRKT